jgi:Uma2 family endonuclease
MTPHYPEHSYLQEVIADTLKRHLPGGRTPPEFAIQTSAGVRVADVVWCSLERRQEIRRLGGNAARRAPEICVEVLSGNNADLEMGEKRALYFEAGAQEVWLCSEDGTLRFFTPAGEHPQSQIAPNFPGQIQVD